VLAKIYNLTLKTFDESYIFRKSTFNNVFQIILFFLSKVRCFKIVYFFISDIGFSGVPQLSTLPILQVPKLRVSAICRTVRQTEGSFVEFRWGQTNNSFARCGIKSGGWKWDGRGIRLVGCMLYTANILFSHFSLACRAHAICLPKMRNKKKVKQEGRNSGNKNK